jgi:replicative DNA helicase
MHAPLRPLPTPASERTAPHNIELEQALLGAILVNNEAFYRVSDLLEPGHFFEPLHQQIFQFCVDLISIDKVASPITLKSFLPGDYTVAGLTIAQYLARLSAEATTVINAMDYGRTIRALAARRDLIAIGEELIEASYEMAADTSPRMVATAGIERLDEIVAIGAYAKRSRFEIGRAADEAVQDLSERLQNPGRRVNVSWGLKDFDRAAPCLRPGDLVILGGRPGMAKTGSALACSLRAAKSGCSILFFSLEMTAPSLANRAIADICYGWPVPTNDFRRELPQPISYFDIDQGRISDADFDRIEDARRLLQTIPIVIEEQAALTLAQIAARARKEQQRLERKERSLDLVVVDHMHLVRPSNRYSGHRVHEVSEVSAGLKAVAKELHVPVLGLAQLSRSVEGREDKRPQLSDLRDSGSIEQDADAVIFVYREEYYLKKRCDDPGEEAARLARLGEVSNRLEFIIAKQRHGPTDTVRVHFDAATNHIDNLARGGS